MAANAGWPQRTAALTWPGAGEVAAELATRDWRPQEFVLMARPALPLPAPDRVEIVDQTEVHAFWERSWRQVLPLTGRDLDAVVSQLIGREKLNDAVVEVTDLVVREAGEVVAAAQLRRDGATAAVDSVLTDPAAPGPRARRCRAGAGGRPCGGSRLRSRRPRGRGRRLAQGLVRAPWLRGGRVRLGGPAAGLS